MRTSPRPTVRLVLLALVVAGSLPGPAPAQSTGDRWVTDELEITLRTGKSTRQSILRMLPSGARLELLETDSESGYSRVRTPGGTEGWVLTRYLLAEPPPRVTLPAIEQRLEQSEALRAELEASNRELARERNALAEQLSSASATGSELRDELEEIRRLSANAIRLDDENEQLRQRLAETEQLLSAAQAETRRLASRATREWFVVGAGVVVLGIILGLILPRLRWRRKSSWGEL